MRLEDLVNHAVDKENFQTIQNYISLFLPGHFKAYTIKLNSLDGVYYCDIRPNMMRDTLLKTA